ncbi:MAG: cytidylate kinase-like family protein [Dehalococcoidia bacterium]
MACRVISISRSMGAGGEEIGRLVARELGFRYADEEIIVKAAERAGVSAETVAKVEQAPSMIERILESIGRTPPDPEGWSGAALAASTDRSVYEGLIERVIRQTAGEGDAVIVAHGASVPLAGTEGVLRLLVTASPEVRAKRVAERTSLGEAAAKKAVAASDRERKEYLRRFYGVGREQPTHYDLVVNTDALSPALAAQLVVAAARA